MATYFGINAEKRSCTFIGVYENTSSIDKSKFNEFTHLIEKTYYRKSASGATEYHRYRILTTTFNETTIAIENAKIISISKEYWWNLGKFNNSNEIFFPNYNEPDKIDYEWCLCFDYLHYEINKTPNAFPMCFVEFEDSRGYKRLVPAGIDSMESVESIESILHGLLFIGYFKSYTTGKLFSILRFMANMPIYPNRQAELKKYFIDYVQRLYEESRRYNLQNHDSIIEELYESVKKRAFNS